MKNLNSFNSEQKLVIDNKIYKYFDIKKVSKIFNIDLQKVPISLKIILENLLRNEDGENISKKMISTVFNSIDGNNNNNLEISFFPTRVLMQDFTGVPAVADLAAMRNALKDRGLEPKILVCAEISYEERHLAKNSGFRWNDAIKGAWSRKMSRRDIEKLEFPVHEVESQS